jgi:subtilisin family serine protease
MRILRLLVALAAASAAQAQIRLPSLPALPLPSVPQTLDQAEPKTLDALSDLRQREITRLIQSNRRLIEADPNGEPIVRSEILAMGMSEEAIAQAQARGFVIDREQAVASANIRLLVLKAPPHVATKKALRQLREADPTGLYDFNHIYTKSAALSGDDSRAEAIAVAAQPSLPHIRVGLLDTGVDATHPVFRNAEVHAFGCDHAQVPNAHGTAVASLLVAHASADLYAADVYCGMPTGGSVDAIVGALAWMVEERVAVINVSLVGPKNVMLEHAVRSLIERGYVIVAAVGNDGPAAPPLYPAAYADVIGVTAVDAHRRVLIEAERGPQVMFAALGADLKAASMDHGYAAVRGTSFAAPTVTRLLAVPLSAPDRQAAVAAIDTLAKQAIHLGAAGKDLTYGFGLVGGETR